jgi:IclR family transcriptional regulator, pca regulon regulatory protein
MMTEPSTPEERYAVPALERGLRILTLFDEKNACLSLSEIARLLGLGRSTVFRLVYTLEQGGFLQKIDDRHYQLGRAEQDIVDQARPVLQRLRDLTNASAHLGFLEGREVVYLAREPSRQMLISNIGVGSRLPAHQTTMGRMLLSALPAESVWQLYQGFAFPEGGIDTADKLVETVKGDAARGFVATESAYGPGLVSVAALVRDRTGHAVAAINVSAPSIVLPISLARKRVADDVVAAAEELSRVLGYRERFKA